MQDPVAIVIKVRDGETRIEPLMGSEALPNGTKLFAQQVGIWIPEEDGDWYCPNCQVGLSPSRVTNHERCDTCGTPVVLARPHTFAVAPGTAYAAKRRARSHCDCGRELSPGLCPVCDNDE